MPRITKRLLPALADVLPDKASVEGLEFEVRDEDRSLQVTIVTRTPGWLIGRRGSTADIIRRALADAANDRDLQVLIREWKPPH